MQGTVGKSHNCFPLPDGNAPICLNKLHFKANKPVGAQMGTPVFAIQNNVGAGRGNDNCFGLKQRQQRHWHHAWPLCTRNKMKRGNATQATSFSYYLTFALMSCRAQKMKTCFSIILI